MSQKRFTGAKIVIYGGSGVGKTAFAVRYITKRFIGDYDRDREMTYTYKPASARDDVTLEILDTCSKPNQDTLEKQVRWAEGFIFLFSLTDKSTLNYLVFLKDLIERVKGRDVPLVLVGNKLDLVSAREVTEEDAQELAGKFDCPKFEISVADSVNDVMDVMEELLCQLKREYIKNLASTNSSLVDNKPKSKLYSMKKAFKKRINRSHSDTF